MPMGIGARPGKRTAGQIIGIALEKLRRMPINACKARCSSKIDA
jgi:hypothetical protein